MASPPRYRRLNPPDVSQVSVKSASDEVIQVQQDTGFTDSLPQLNSFMESVTDAMDSKLTRAQNMLSQKKVLKVRTSDLPITFDCTLGISPEVIRLGQAQVLTTGGNFNGAVDVSRWELLPGNQIRYTHIPGLLDNTDYQLTIFIE